MTSDIGIVFVVLIAAGVLFAIERVPNDITALAVAVSVALLEPWTGVTPSEAISGFSSPATITVLAMFILSEGVRRTGVVQTIGKRLKPGRGKGEKRPLAMTLTLGGPPAALVNNTPLVGVLIPLVVDLARRARTSPSKLLMPLSFISMMGGMLTLIGSSTNILASDLARSLLGRPFHMFEFTHLGLVVLVIGGAYLMTIGHRLTPDRIRPEQDLTNKFGLREYLHRAVVLPDSRLINLRIGESQLDEDWDLDILQIERAGEVFIGQTTDQHLQSGDRLTIRAAVATFDKFAHAKGLRPLPALQVSDDEFIDTRTTLIEATVAPDSSLAGNSLVSSDFRHRYGGTVLAIQRSDQLSRSFVERQELQEGDSLLLMLDRAQQSLLDEDPALVITSESPFGASHRAPRSDNASEDAESRAKTPHALAIVVGVITAAAIGIVPIYIAALAGVVLTVAVGVIPAGRAYDAVSWDIIFLLAGVIPLGLALQRSGAANYLAELIASRGASLHPILLLGVFYLLTACLTNVISNNATIVLMAPIAVDVATTLDANPLAYLLATTFAASTSFMTPVGYQTNLLVLTPGGYRFTDYLRVGAPLQLLLAVVTTLGIVFFWGV